MNRIAVLVLCGLATAAALFVNIWPIVYNQGQDDVNGFGRQRDWLAEEPFPPALTQKVFPIGIGSNITSRRIQMDKDDRYQEYIFDTFANGDKGTLFFNERSVLTELTMEYAATGTKAWFRLADDGVTILQKRTSNLSSGALIEEGERGPDNRFVLRTYAPGTKQVTRIRTYEARAMILRGGLASIDLTARDESFYSNNQLAYLFVASDVLHSQRWDYAPDGKATKYLKIDYRAQNGWFFYPDGQTKRMSFERKRIERNGVGYWEVHTDYFDPRGALEANRVFTRSSMIVSVDLPGIGKVHQTWQMIVPYKAEPLRLLKDNFALAFVELDSFAGLNGVRFVYKDGALSEFWYQTRLKADSSSSIQVRLALDAASGSVMSQTVLDQKTQKQLSDVELVDVSPSRIVAPASLNQMLDYDPPPALAFEPDYPQWEH